MNETDAIYSSRELSSKALVSRLSLGALILLFLVIAVTCIFLAIKWVNKPFPGFLINQRMVVAPIGQYHWTGTQKGLKYPDKIISANGEEISTAKELEEVIAHTFVGTPINYEVERSGTRFFISVPTMRFSWVDLMAAFGTVSVAGIVYFFIGLTVLILKPDTKVSWTFLNACFFLSIWSITIFDMQSTHFGFIRVYLLANAFIPAAFIHFSLYFPQPNKFVSKYPAIQILPYLISMALIIPTQLFYPHEGFKIFYSLAFYYNIFGMIMVLSPIVAAYFWPISVLARQRARVVLLGAAIAFPIPVTAYLSQLLFGSFLGLRIQTNFLALPLSFFPASIAYAIAKHNLFDVDVYLKRAVGYFIMTAVVISAYLGLSVSLNFVLGQYEVAQSRVFPILFTLGIILIFNPLRDRIQALVDRIFFRKEYDYGEIVEKIGDAMTSLLDLGQILKKLAGTFIEDMFINNSAFMLLNPVTAEYQVYLAEGENKQAIEDVVLKMEDPLVKIFEKEKKELTKYDMLEDPQYKAVSKKCVANFERLQASLLVPLVYQEKVIGLFSLGEKKSGKFYNRQDIDLLHVVANQGAVAIENARLFQENLEKQRMEEELAIGRELQMSMLPAECPQIEGFEIAAFSESAREVGGDFYDFIEISESELGIVIGDVTGKSVSGALVMSASRSIFRMLGEDKLTVSESMIRANRRTKKDIKTGMFVALLYAVLRAEDKCLSLCSAGQTQPIFRSAMSGETKLVETQGDTFPLGILDEAEYEDTQLKLEAGDKVILYTDGIVEAMNEQKEMFGFDRLLEVISNSQTKTAESLLDEIKSSVNEFAGSASQHDDITIIVIQAV